MADPKRTFDVREGIVSLTGRRDFVLATSALLAASLARAQTAGKVHRVTFLAHEPPQGYPHLIAALMEGLRALGYEEGRNLVFEVRHTEGKLERLPELASDVVRSN